MKSMLSYTVLLRAILLSLLLVSAGQYLQAQIRVACVGNSITFGSGIENREVYSYPAQLQLILGDTWEVKNYGVGGRTMLKKGNKPIWKEQKFKDALAYKPDVVIIKLGTNDAKPINWEHSEDYLKDYQAMIDTFKSVSNPIIFVCQLVPAYSKKWEIQPDVVEQEILPMIAKIGKKNKLEVIDLFTPFVGKPELFPDTIHPNGHGAALMAGIIARSLWENEEKIIAATKK